MRTSTPFPARETSSGTRNAGDWFRKLRDKGRSAAVHVEDLSKTFEGAVVDAVHNLSLEVAAGEVCALVGPTGAGKSTTLKLICGLLVPTAGRITINSLDVERETEEVQMGIGFLGSPFGLDPGLRAWEYLDCFARAYRMPPGPAGERADSLLDQFGLAHLRDVLVEDLPRGTRLLLGLARALVHDPALLILDEPTIGLDAKERAFLKRLLAEQQAQGKTILLASPTVTDVEVACDTVRLIEHGRLLPPDRAERLLEEAGTTGEVV